MTVGPDCDVWDIAGSVVALVAAGAAAWVVPDPPQAARTTAPAATAADAPRANRQVLFMRSSPGSESALWRDIAVVYERTRARDRVTHGTNLSTPNGRRTVGAPRLSHRRTLR